MVTELQVLFAVELALIFLITLDSIQQRDWMGTRKLVVLVLLTVLVPVVGAVIYIAVVRRHERRLIECPECGGLLSESEQACPHCGFDPEQARDHKEGPHRCDSCDAEFDTARGLRKHRARHHGDDSDGSGSGSRTRKDVRTDSHACPTCGAEFDTERGLHVHESVKHG